MKLINSISEANTPQIQNEVKNLYDLRKIYNETNVEIPKFQRKYEWNDEVLQDFINDIFNVVEGNNYSNSHFFNSMVVIETNNKRVEIIDGQQRSISTFLLFYILEQLFNSSHFSIKKEKIRLLNLDKYKNLNLDKTENVYLSSIKNDSNSFKVNRLLRKDVLSYKEITPEYIFNILKILSKDEEYNNLSKHSKLDEKTFNDISSNFDKSSDVNSTFLDNIELIKKSNSSIEEKKIFSLVNCIFLCKANKIYKKNILEDEFFDNLCNSEIEQAFNESLINCKKEYFNSNKTPSDRNIAKFNDSKFLYRILQFFIVFDEEKTLKFFKTNKKDPFYTIKNNLNIILNNIAHKHNTYKEYFIKHPDNLENDENFIEENINDYSYDDYFIDAIKKGLENCQFSSVKITSSDRNTAIDSALSAFKSINSTGQGLNVIDIINSDLLLKGKDIDDQINQFQIDLIKKNQLLNFKTDDAIKFFLSFHLKKYSKADLYRSYQKVIKNLDDDPIKFIEEFNEFLENINSINDGIISSNYSASLHVLSRYARKNKTLYPVLVRIINLSNDNVNFEGRLSLINSLLFYLVRYTVTENTKGLVPKFEELLSAKDNFYELESKIKECFELKDDQDSKIERAFIDSDIDFYSRGELGRIISILHEGFLRFNNDNDFNKLKPDFNIICDEGELEPQVEHIYPQSKNKSLKGFPGNLTILKKLHNGKAGNQEFFKKISYLWDSQLFLNRKIVKHNLDIFFKKNKFKVDYEKISLTGKGKDRLLKIPIEGKDNMDITQSFTFDNLDLEYLIGKKNKNGNNFIEVGELSKEKIKILKSKDIFINSLSVFNNSEDYSTSTLNTTKCLSDKIK
ncbi:MULTISPECIES: GmrSD restriction endonuclease domain-containing protein [Flammeovirga]|uniref:DUF262 domain-containing protein n=1 Tax=Flammeovirga agarivorans TaxID=2726742 RepID=A0A7X8SKN1_9BACT|nr:MULTISPECIES: DUF262 domain-containing protein [Flammeovirga]KXX68899.1 hypothetical protein AVL50_17210 [Flammeovirga sp. SJP92]NLR91915.1 DUF262 domain-containing protein [Flammeovirga agarivorans]